MTEYNKLAEIFETAEVLSHEYEGKLEVEAINETTGNVTTVIFEFGEEEELTRVYVED